MIRKIFTLLGFLFCIVTYAQYDITVKIDGLTCEDELLLANHFGDKQYLKDTSECIDGVVHFRGEETLESGVYLIVLPKKTWYEVLISEDEDQTKYSFQADTSLNPENMKVSGSKENELFLAFNLFAREQSKIAKGINEKMQAATDEDEKAKLKKKLYEPGERVAEKRQEIAKSHPMLFIGKLYNAMGDVNLPETPSSITEEDDIKTWQYLWLRNHYWDNVDLEEDGLVRSPVFHSKLKGYFDSYMPPLADTAIMMADDLINRIEKSGSKEQYKYSVHYLLGYFEDAKYMCFDKAVWHMAKNYYCAGKAWWSDSSYVAKMCEESAKMEPTLCEMLAPELVMPDTSLRQRVTMSAIDKPVTVLIFWDINCGHCKKEMPIVSRQYDSMTNKYHEIYAVYTQGDWEGWEKRVKEEGYKFINVANAFGEDKFRNKYNIRTTPQIFILDKDKNIRFKKIGAKDIPGTVQYLLEEQGVLPKKEKSE